MTVTARHTTAALKRHVLPLLHDAGFTDGTARKLWRHADDRIAHIEINGFSPYDAKVLGCTTASVVVRLGLSLTHYSAQYDPFHRDHIPDGPVGPRPRESQMPIRGVLAASDAPALTKGRWGWDYDPIFKIETVEDTDTVARDIALQFERYGLDWLSRDWTGAELVTLLERDEVNPHLATWPNGAHLWLAAEHLGFPIRDAHLTMARKQAESDV